MIYISPRQESTGRVAATETSNKGRRTEVTRATERLEAGALEQGGEVTEHPPLRPLTGRELNEQHKALIEAGASWDFIMSWLHRELSRWGTP